MSSSSSSSSAVLTVFPASASNVSSATEAGAYPIWLPPKQYADDKGGAAHISKANLLTGKQHRNRLRTTQQYLATELFEWVRNLTRRNLMLPKDDIFIGLENGELLCAIVNMVCPTAEPIPITWGAPVKSLQCRQHVGAFLKACDRLGIEAHNLFKPKDLIKRNNDRRTMRTMLYFSLALMKFGVKPLPVLEARILSLCRTSGYTIPEVLIAGKNLLGRVRGHSGNMMMRVSPRAPAFTSHAPAGASSSSALPAVESFADRSARLEAERVARLESAKEFRPQLQFIGGGRGRKPQQKKAMEPALSSPSATAATSSVGTSHEGRAAPASSSVSPRTAFGAASLASPSGSNALSPYSAASWSSPSSITAAHLDALPVRNEGYTNIGVLTHDALTGYPYPSFPYAQPAFDEALQRLDLNDLLQSATDETDIDKPLMAALLFPEFEQLPEDGAGAGAGGDAAASAGGATNHGAWKRQGAELQVRVEPIKYAMWTSRHPLMAFASVFSAWILSIILVFGIYPTPFKIDLSIQAFHAANDQYFEMAQRYKATVQNSREYYTAKNATLVYDYSLYAANSRPTRQSASTIFADAPSLTHGLVEELLKQHTYVQEVNRAESLLAGVHDASGASVFADDASSSPAEHSVLDSIARELLHSAAGDFDLDSRWKQRAREQAAKLRQQQRARVVNSWTGGDGEGVADENQHDSTPHRRLLVTDADALTLASTLSIIYMPSFASFNYRGSNLLTEERLTSLKAFEAELASTVDYRTYCLYPTTTATGLQLGVVTDTGRYIGCQFPDSALNYYAARLDTGNGIMYNDGANSTSIHNITLINSLLQTWNRYGFFDAGFSVDAEPASVYSSHLISTFAFGVPLPPASEKGSEGWTIEQQISWLQNRILDTYINIVEGATLDDGLITVAIDGPGVQYRILRNIIFQHDLRLIIGSIACVMIYSLFHIRSVFIVVGSMVQMLFAFFITAFWFRVVFQMDTLYILHVLCLFVVLAMGTNDMFVLFDTFWHSSLLRLRVELPYDRAARKKRQAEKDRARRKEDCTLKGKFIRWWYDESGCYEHCWRAFKRIAPCFTVTDLDLDEHFELAKKKPDGAPRSFTTPQQQTRNILPIPASNANGVGIVGVNAGVRSSNPRGSHFPRRSLSSTPTRIEKDSDTDEEFPRSGENAPRSSPNASAIGSDGHQRVASIGDVPLDNQPDMDSPEVHSSPVSPRRALPDAFSSADTGGDGAGTFRSHTNSTRQVAFREPGTTVDAFGVETHHDAAATTNAPIEHDLSTEAGRAAHAAEKEKARLEELHTKIENLDHELDDEEEASNLAAMASRHGGVKSAIQRKQSDRLALRLSWTYRRTLPSMLVTNGTIIIALFAIGVSDIVPIKSFAIFMGSVSIVNFCLSLTFLPTIIVLQYMYLKDFNIIPRAWWNMWRRWTSSIDHTVNHGDIKYDQALLDEADELAAERAAATAGAVLTVPAGSAPPPPPNTSLQFVSPSSSPRLQRRASAGDDDFNEPGPQVRGGVTFTKENEEDWKEEAPTVSNGASVAGAAAATSGSAASAPSAAAIEAEQKHRAGALVKRQLASSLDAERAKANKSLEKSRRNQFILFLNATIFRFRFVLIGCWVLILAVCLSRAVLLRVPSNIITILPSTSNLELLKQAYAKLPSCTDCTYEFDRIEHSIVSYGSSTGLPITIDTGTGNSQAQGGDAVVSTQSKRADEQRPSVLLAVDAVQKQSSMLFASLASLDSHAEVLSANQEIPETAQDAEILEPTEADRVETLRFLTSQASPKTSPAPTVRDLFRSRRSTYTVEFASSSKVSSAADYLTQQIGLPSPPPLLVINSLSFSSMRITFAQSLFSGREEIDSYTLIIRPVGAAEITPDQTNWSTTRPVCQSSVANSVSYMTVKLKPRLAQTSLSAPIICQATEGTSCQVSPTAAAFSINSPLPAVTLGADWFSSATISGGPYVGVGLTYAASGAVKYDLSGFTHNTEYDLTIIATSLAGSSNPSPPLRIRTPDATPVPPSILSANVGSSDVLYFDSEGDGNVQFGIENISVAPNFASKNIPRPSLITIYWSASASIAGQLPALPVDGRVNSWSVDLSSATPCTQQASCLITLPSVVTTQVRGGYALDVWATTTNVYTEGPPSAPFTIAEVPMAAPFAPIVVGYVIVGQPYIKPTLRLFFQLPCLNGGEGLTQPTRLRLYYLVNAGLITEDRMQQHEVDWAAAVADGTLKLVDLFGYPLHDTLFKLKLSDLAAAPIWQLDLTSTQLTTTSAPAVAFLPNRVLQVRLKAIVADLASSASNVLLVSTPTVAILAPIIAMLEYNATETANQLTVTWTPAPPSDVDPDAVYSYRALLTAANPLTDVNVAAGRSALSFPTQKSSAVTSVQLTVLPNTMYFVSAYTSTTYGRSIEIAPLQCFITKPGDFKIDSEFHSVATPSLTSCPELVVDTKVCTSMYGDDIGTDIYVEACSPKTVVRFTPFDYMTMYQQPPMSSPSYNAFTITRRINVKNVGNGPMTIESISSIPLQFLHTFDAPDGSNSQCLLPSASEYDPLDAFDAACFVPCFSQHCSSLCGSISFSLQSARTGPIGAGSQRTKDSGIDSSTLAAGLHGLQDDVDLIVIVTPKADIDVGLYTCAFNWGTIITDKHGGTTSNYGYINPGNELPARGPFDFILALRVLPLDRPTPVRKINVHFQPTFTDAGVVTDLPNYQIAFTVPYSVPSDPICFFELQYGGDSLYISSPTAAEGFTVSSLLNSKLGITADALSSFSIRGYNARGALDFESVTNIDDCTSNVLQTCHNQGACITPLYVFEKMTRGVYTDKALVTKRYPILTNLFSHDVRYVISRTDPAQSCECDAGFFGAQCTRPCPGTEIIGLPATFSSCSAQGRCNLATHQCTCEASFAGAGCEISCPSGCNALGTCSVNPATGAGECACFPESGYGGVACDVLCPIDGSSGLPCAGRGACDANAECACDAQHRGPTCSSRCPGSYSSSNGTLKVCNGRGTCSATVPAMCICDDALDTSADCSLNPFSEFSQLSFIHYDLPPAPSLPKFVFPIIHLVWGVSGYKENDQAGVSSASTDADSGSRSVSITSAQSAGTPLYYTLFDMTSIGTQQYLAAVCDVVFISGLIKEDVSRCLMTVFRSWCAQQVKSGQDIRLGWPLPSYLVTKAWITFLDTLQGDDAIWRQHVSFVFTPLVGSTSASMLMDVKHANVSSIGIHEFKRKYIPNTAKLDLDEALSTGADATSSSESVHLNYYQLTHLMNHEGHGRDFQIVWHGDEDGLSESSASSHTATTQSRYSSKVTVLPSIHVKITSITFEWYGTFDSTATSLSDSKIYMANWNHLVYEHLNAAAPVRLGPAFHTSSVWLKISQHDTFAAGVTNGFVILFVFIFFFVTIFTGWNIRLGLLILFTILCLVCVLFGILVLTSTSNTTDYSDGVGGGSLGNVLGVIEYICCQIIIAISIFYLMYLGHAYIKSPFNTRFGRTRHALLEWGSSIVSAGFAMMFSSFVLIFATINVLSTMGQILCLMSMVILIFTFTFFVPLLQTIGPMMVLANPKDITKKADVPSDTSVGATSGTHVRGTSIPQSAAGTSIATMASTTLKPNFGVPVGLEDPDQAQEVTGLGLDARSGGAIGVTPGGAFQREQLRLQALEQQHQQAIAGAASEGGVSQPHYYSPGGWTPRGGRADRDALSSIPPSSSSAVELQRISTHNSTPHGPSRHERKAAQGQAPNPLAHLNKQLRKTNSGTLMLSSSEDEEEDDDSDVDVDARRTLQSPTPGDGPAKDGAAQAEPAPSPRVSPDPALRTQQLSHRLSLPIPMPFRMDEATSKLSPRTPSAAAPPLSLSGGGGFSSKKPKLLASPSGDFPQHSPTSSVGSEQFPATPSAMNEHNYTGVRQPSISPSPSEPPTDTLTPTTPMDSSNINYNTAGYAAPPSANGMSGTARDTDNKIRRKKKIANISRPSPSTSLDFNPAEIVTPTSVHDDAEYSATPSFSTAAASAPITTRTKRRKQSRNGGDAASRTALPPSAEVDETKDRSSSPVAAPTRAASKVAALDLRSPSKPTLHADDTDGSEDVPAFSPVNRAKVRTLGGSRISSPVAAAVAPSHSHSDWDELSDDVPSRTAVPSMSLSAAVPTVTSRLAPLPAVRPPFGGAVEPLKPLGKTPMRAVLPPSRQLAPTAQAAAAAAAAAPAPAAPPPMQLRMPQRPAPKAADSDVELDIDIEEDRDAMQKISQDIEIDHGSWDD